MAKICFFSTTPKNRIKFEQYTSNDLKILSQLGHQVSYASNIFQIPLDCNLVYSWWLTGSVVPAIFCFLKNIPLLIVAGGNEGNAFLPKNLIRGLGYFSMPIYKKLAVLISIYKAEYILCVSNYISNSLKIIYPSCTYKLKTIYNCVDKEVFFPKYDNKSYNLITTITSFDEESIKVKRLYKVVEAFNLAWIKNKSLKLIIIGRNGPKYNDIEKMLSKRLPKSAYELLIDMDSHSIAAIFQKTSVFCQFSVAETFGLSVAEAFSCGASLLLSTGGALEEVFNNKATFVQNIDNIEEIADQIIKLNKFFKFNSIKKNLKDYDEFSFIKRKKNIKHIIEKII